VQAFEEEKSRLEAEHHDKLLMIDREELLRIARYLSEQPLEKEVSVGDTTYAAGEKIPEEVVREINRFALRSVVQSYSDTVQNEYESMKNYFIKQKKKLKQELEEKLLKQIKRKRGNILKGLELIGAGGEATLKTLGIPDERIKPILEALSELQVKRELYEERVRLQLTSMAPDGVERIK
jgi:hypothetical protein